jgi:hypothetical protein
MATAAEIAQWMPEEYRKHNRLDQSRAASHIRREFGEEWVYRNKQRNWAIHRDVLAEFRKLTPDDVVWSRSNQLWRQRREFDPPGKRMVT